MNKAIQLLLASSTVKSMKLDTELPPMFEIMVKDMDNDLNQKIPGKLPT